ncbi:tabserin-like isoform X2 [Phymastichus coffea]|uniref:tabserin-like isoform X2 n=1 Tax=Phymastichus coffea TaxID=108790 RepID=UPI00273C9D3F|nr:tabserin-like isoform X2 [Phymastichus coffea]XP_058795416.1 tabserin-like isoform X2 [Phymastichus coffea]
MQSTMLKHFTWLILLGIGKPSYVKALIDKENRAISNVTFALFKIQIPFVVSIANTAKDFDEEYLHECSGSLISDKLVLTVAHCLDNKELTDLQVFVGSNNLRNTRAYEIESWIIYCEWYILKNYQDCDSKANDIAIIQLIKAVENLPNNLHFKPAILSFKEKDQLLMANDSFVFTVGWGSTQSVYPTVLLKITALKLISDTECEERLKKIGASAVVTRQFICSMGEPSWILLTDGDSGGPLLNRNYAIIGINKGVIPNQYDRKLCKEVVRTYKSNVHMNLSSYKNFIKEIMMLGVSGCLSKPNVPV